MKRINKEILLFISGAIGLTIALIFIKNWDFNETKKVLSMIIVTVIQIYFIIKILLNFDKRNVPHDNHEQEENNGINNRSAKRTNK